jgi:hypothetical protein
MILEKYESENDPEIKSSGVKLEFSDPKLPQRNG